MTWIADMQSALKTFRGSKSAEFNSAIQNARAT